MAKSTKSITTVRNRPLSDKRFSDNFDLKPDTNFGIQEEQSMCIYRDFCHENLWGLAIQDLPRWCQTQARDCGEFPHNVRCVVLFRSETLWCCHYNKRKILFHTTMRTLQFPNFKSSPFSTRYSELLRLPRRCLGGSSHLMLSLRELDVDEQ